MGQLGLHCEWSSREVVGGWGGGRGWWWGGMVRTLQNQEERPKRQSVRATRAGARGFILSAFKKGGINTLNILNASPSHRWTKRAGEQSTWESTVTAEWALCLNKAVITLEAEGFPPVFDLSKLMYFFLLTRKKKNPRSGVVEKKAFDACGDEACWACPAQLCPLWHRSRPQAAEHVRKWPPGLKCHAFQRRAR